jgi:hypothetical protein
VSPTALRVGRYRLFFLAREEEWPHVHVASPDGEAKCWLEPTVEWAKGHGLDDREREQILRIVMEHRDDFVQSRHRHFGR